MARIEAIRVEPATLIVYRQHLERRLVPAFGNLKLRQITRARVEAYLAQLDAAGEISHKTANESLGRLGRTWLAPSARASSPTTRPRASTVMRLSTCRTTRRRSDR